MVTTVIVASILVIPATLAAAQDSPPQTVPTVSTAATTEPAVTTPEPSDSPAPWVPSPMPDSQPTPAATAAPTQPVQALLIKQVRTKLVGYVKSARHWQSWLGKRPARPINVWSLGSLQRATHLLATWKNQSHQLHLAARRLMRQRIKQYRSTVEHWRLVAGIHPAVRTLASRPSLEEQFAWWRQAQKSVLEIASHPPYEPQLLCIHGGEGSWTDPNAPYWGGLQMDLGFMAHYGGYLLRTKGTADHWTPLEQMWVAAKAVPSRGFYPWPNTGRACGLIG